MIHYHGGPITPVDAAIRAWTRRHAMISYAEPRQVELAAEVSQSFALDNGAFSAWKVGKEVDWHGYLIWVREWMKHPAFDFALIPDVIDGTEQDNDDLVRWWDLPYWYSVPVWHLHESVTRLMALCCRYPRVALGSSGQWATPGTAGWWRRIAEAMDVICDKDGRPKTKLHGLRMLAPTIFSHLPLASADSTNVARNIGIDSAWKGTYQPVSKATRAAVLAERIEHHAPASTWNRATAGIQENLELMG